MRWFKHLALVTGVAIVAMALVPRSALSQTCFSCRTNEDQKHQDGQGTDDYEGNPHSGTGWHTNPCNWAHDGPVQNCGGGGQQSMTIGDYESLKRFVALGDDRGIRALLASRKNVALNVHRRMVQVTGCDGQSVVVSLRVGDGLWRSLLVASAAN